MAQLAGSDGQRWGLRPALETNHCPAAIDDGSFRAVVDACRAFSTASRVVIGIDDALERMRTIVGGRHCFFGSLAELELVLAGRVRYE